MLSARMPDLLALQLLLAVRQHGGVGAAGTALGITQQAASARVRAMERQVGVPLVVRGARGSRLTPSGQLLARWADAVVDAATELDAGIAALRSDRAVHLDVAASLTVAEQLVPRWLVALRDRRAAAGEPPVEVRLDPANSDAVADAVRSGAVDLGFTEGPETPAGLATRVVAHDRLVVAVAPDHPWARRRRVRAPQLAATPLVSRESGSGTREALRQTLAAHLPPGTSLVPPALELASAAAVRASVVAGLAPGALSSLAIADDLTLGRLVAVDVVDPAGRSVDLTRDLRAVWVGCGDPPAGPARDLVAIASRELDAPRGGRSRPAGRTD